jgi:hypothetical protein
MQTRRTLLTLGLVAAQAAAQLPQKGFATRRPVEKFYGAWQLIDYPQMGPHPIGRLAYDALGRMYVQIVRGDLPPFASGKREGTAQEIHDAWMGSLSYYGAYFINTEHKVLLHRIEASSFPNWIKSDQEVKYEFLNDDQLALTATVDGQQHRSVWQRGR